MFQDNPFNLPRFCWGKILSYGTFVSIPIFLILVFLKFDFIENGILISDDLELPWRMKQEGFTDPLPGRPVGSFLHYTTSVAFPSISYQMVFYLMTLSITALIVFFLLYQIFSQTWLLVLAILFAFTSHAVTSAGQFASGSHGVVGLMFALIGLLLSCRSILSDLSYSKRVALALGAGIFFVLASLTSTYYYIIYFAGSFWIFSFGSRFFRYRMVWIAISITLVPLAILLLYKFSTGSIHPYDRITGWADFTFTHLLRRMFSYVVYVVGIYSENIPDPLILCAATLGGATFMWLALKFGRVMTPRTSISDRTKRRFGISGFFVLSMGTLLTLAPALPVTWAWQPRHVYPSMILAVLAAFFMIDLMLAHWRNLFSNIKWIKWIVILFSGLLLGYNVSTTYHYQNRYYGSLLAYQPMLKEFLSKEKEIFSKGKGGQVIIASDIPPHFTHGFNHWSTFFLRTHTGDETLFGLIGREENMTEHEHPFIESYRHWDERYWKIVEINGRPSSRLRQMFGIVQGAPTYAYRFDASDGTVQRVRWLLVNASDGWSLYRMTEEGIVLHESGTDAPASLDRLGIARKDVFIYGKTN